MYAKYFKVLITKKVAKWTLDSRALTLSVTGINKYLMPDPETRVPWHQPNVVSPIGEGGMVTPASQPLGNVTFTDPMVDDAVAQIHLPQLEGKSDESFEKH